MEEKQRIQGHQARLTGAMVIATMIVLMSALLAFITLPPQPVILLLGILIAVIIYWAARLSTRPVLRSGVPHEEKLAGCADCGIQYCVVCHESCPDCGSVHIRPTP